jgi:hypothetical protein
METSVETNAHPLAHHRGCGKKRLWPVVSGPSSLVPIFSYGAKREGSRAPREGGFALLITVTLLAFITIVLVGLAAYTRVETAVAGNTQRQAQARENALLGLNIALAQLQQHAGPDQRVTATAEAFSPAPGTARYTGVWRTDETDPTHGGASLQTWLVSGNELPGPEGPLPLAVTPADSPGTNTAVTLVGTNTSRVANDVMARLIPIEVAGVPGAGAGTPTIGRYAWWVGDQGVKAPVASGDPTTTAANYDYGPFTSAEMRRRIRQQVPMGAGAFERTTTPPAPAFEPRDVSGSPSNSTLASNTTAFAQLAFLRTATGTVGLPALQRHFHSWSPGNFNVLASTGPSASGLRRDLSLRPDLLGAAFASWAKYTDYMEDPASPFSPEPLPAYSEDPVRRRYRITAAIEEDGIRHSVAPVLSFFGISFSLRNDTTTNSPTMLEASARCVMGLWNPYTAALVPEDLEILITGLPEVRVESQNAPARFVNLQSVFTTSDGVVKFALPFTPNDQDPDRSSWLPGRVYNWSAVSSNGDPGAAGYDMEFYRRDATLTGRGVVRSAGPPLGPNTISGTQNTRQCVVTVPQILTIELRRAADGEVIGQFTSPVFQPFQTDDTRPPGNLTSDFAYVFRLPDRIEIPEGEVAPWLQADGRDPRESPFPQIGRSGYLVAGGQPPQPELLVTPGLPGFPATYSHLLLDRHTSGRSYNEDVPVFELPRAPLLSLGVLQHVHVVGGRPFSFGNSWAGARNAWFDQHFFSGLTPEVEWANTSRPLPGGLLRVVGRRPDGSAPTPEDVKGAERMADAYSSKYLLQGGAFNLNSLSPAAWAAVLRSIRFPAATATNFTFANVSMSSGTSSVNNPDATTTLSDPFQSNSRIAVFPRFAQSAQETFEADDGYVQSDPGGSAANIINTPLFRRGLRMLSAAEVDRLADNIVTLLAAKFAESGPYRTLEEFLSASPRFLDSSGEPASLLEKAIEDSGLNTDTALGLIDTSIEFSSQWLTQADIMTALAPVLFPRSDTFVIRAYGEAVNPATNATEGRAWCEAIVQRVPEYFDRSQEPEILPAELNQLNQIHGRRFKVVSFRWLTRSDI